MSSRVFRRLNRARDADVIRLGLGSRQDSEEEEDEEVPVFQPRNKKKGRSKGFVQPVQDPFEVVGACGRCGCGLLAKKITHYNFYHSLWEKMK